MERALMGEVYTAFLSRRKACRIAMWLGFRVRARARASVSMTDYPYPYPYP